MPAVPDNGPYPWEKTYQEAIVTETASRWRYLDLAADFPELEIYTGHGWGPEQETGLLELGERVMDNEADWLFTWFYTRDRDRIWAAVSYLFRAVLQARRDHGKPDPEPGDGWYPDAGAWDRGELP